MFVSAAKKKLNAAIQAATDPADIVQLTTALSRVMDAEGRARGRRQRQKTRAEKANDKRLSADDLDSEFSLDEPAGAERPRR